MLTALGRPKTDRQTPLRATWPDALCAVILLVAAWLAFQAGFDPKAGFSPEDVAASWQQIGDFAGAVHPDDNVTALREMMANLQKHAG